MPNALGWTGSIPAGVPGLVSGAGTFAICYAASWLAAPPGTIGAFEARGPGSFEAGLARYIRLTELTVGLATGSIVLLAGSSVFRSAGNLPKSFGSPLVLLALCVVYAVTFAGLITYSYERSLYDRKYFSRRMYVLVTALGFSGLLSFAMGYLWLVFALVHD